MTTFYKEYVSLGRPCKFYDGVFVQILNSLNQTSLNNENQDYQLEAEKYILPEIFEIFEIDKASIVNSNKDKTANLISKDRLIIQANGEVNYKLIPISQIQKLNPYRNLLNKSSKTYFNSILLKDNLFNLEESNNIKIIDVNLKNGEGLYIPSYFFVQKLLDVAVKTNTSLEYTFESNSRILDSVVKVIFDYMPN